MSPRELYDRDYYAWIRCNAELLRAGRAEEADLEHIAEELDDMSRRERRALQSRLEVLIAHLLKWQVQPDRQSRSWSGTIRLQRREIAKLLEEMPSLLAFLEEKLAETYAEAVERAAAETHLPEDAFPSACPFALDQVLDEKFLP
jgi:hypothetical protein